MDQAPDKSKPSFRATFRRRRKLLSVPMVLGVLAAAFMVAGHSKTYTSTASLWIDTAPPVASSVGADATPLSSAPAQAEQGILSELLTTGSFATAVASNSELGKYLGSKEAIRLEAAEDLETGQVVPLVTGQQILKITYTGPTEAVAMSTLGAVVSQLEQYNNGLGAAHNSASVIYDKAQVRSATSALTTARGALAAYVAQHPSAGLADPNFAALSSAVSQASTQLSQANASLGSATATRDAGGWSISVIDNPSSAVANALGKKKMVEVLLGGLFGGMLVSFLGVIALTPAKKEAWEDELPVGRPMAPAAPMTSFQPRTPGPAPVASPAQAETGLAVPAAVGDNGSRLYPGRRFILRRPAEHAEER